MSKQTNTTLTSKSSIPPLALKKPVVLEDVTAVYYEDDKFGRSFFHLTEELADELIKDCVILKFQGESFPIYYSDYTDQYTLRAKCSTDITKSFVKGATYSLDVVVKTGAMEPIGAKKGSMKNPIAYCKIIDYALTKDAPQKEEEDKEEVVPSPAVTAGKKRKGAKKPTPPKKPKLIPQVATEEITDEQED